jgi:hypothetical protein
VFQRKSLIFGVFHIETQMLVKQKSSLIFITPYVINEKMIKIIINDFKQPALCKTTETGLFTSIERKIKNHERPWKLSDCSEL